MRPAMDMPKISAIPDQALPDEQGRRLSDAFAVAQHHTKPSAITVAVALEGKGLWSGAVTPSNTSRLYWASAGKTFTAVVIMQLAEEGKLSLDDPVSRWVRNVPNGNVATVRDLLAHTSGLFSSNEDEKARAEPRYRDPSESLEIARQHGPLFCTGAYWRYSNTGYDVLGEIVRRADGRSIDRAIDARIIQPLGLRSMIALVPGQSGQLVVPLASSKEAPIDPSWPGAAGPIASNAEDMVRFWHALFAGKLLPDARVNEMFAQMYPMADGGTYYGLGTMIFDVPDGDGRLLWLGHAGGTAGASAVVGYSPQDRAFFAVALTGESNAAPVANLLLKATR